MEINIESKIFKLVYPLIAKKRHADLVMAYCEGNSGTVKSIMDASGLKIFANKEKIVLYKRRIINTLSYEKIIDVAGHGRVMVKRPMKWGEVIGNNFWYKK